MQSSPPRLAHGWTLSRSSGMSQALVREFIRPAVRAVPSSMARRLGSCRISLPAEAEADVTSQWTITNSGLEVSVTTTGFEEHDVAMELLLCLGQALWERLSDAEIRAYWMLLCDEISMGIEGEIDEQALEEKRTLFESRSHANSASGSRVMAVPPSLGRRPSTFTVSGMRSPFELVRTTCRRCRCGGAWN